MKLLIAADDNANRIILEKFLKKWGHDVVTAQDGLEAWNLLNSIFGDGPALFPQMDVWPRFGVGSTVGIALADRHNTATNEHASGDPLVKCTKTSVSP